MYNDVYSFSKSDNIKYSYKLNFINEENKYYTNLILCNKLVPNVGIGYVANSVSSYNSTKPIGSNIYVTGDKIYSTITDLSNYIGDINIIGVLAEPIETELEMDIPVCYKNQTVITVTDVGGLDVYVTSVLNTTKAIELPDGAIAVYDASTQEVGDTYLYDRSNNGNDIQLYNFANTTDSGFFEGKLHFDGIDDVGRLLLSKFNPNIDLESFTYLVENSTTTNSTVYVHQDVYNKFNDQGNSEWYNLNELAKTKNITFSLVES